MQTSRSTASITTVLRYVAGTYRALGSNQVTKQPLQLPKERIVSYMRRKMYLLSPVYAYMKVMSVNAQHQ